MKSTFESIDKFQSVDETNSSIVTLGNHRQVGLRVQTKCADNVKLKETLDGVGVAIQKLSQHKQALLSKSADAKLAKPLEALRALNEKYQEICTGSPLAVADLTKLSIEIDLATT